ncbi:MAG: DNA mismatch repair endonuclease MutL [Treponemataceae bacterium]|nr:DNA mismatch repair endonuclease MutL [Treponemataceae bacterium]
MSTTYRPVRALSPEVARKIAAGEVIDRPASVLREFMDNAIDSGADTISVSIKNGGMDNITVSDNGVGMARSDLEICTEPHTTSKIASVQDLQTCLTLGFRGEALSSIAAVSQLEITTRRQDDDHGWTMKAPLATVGEPVFTPNGREAGTSVSSSAIFENIPARRLFMKRPQAETALCRQTFVEKALPKPSIAFSLTVDGKTRLTLPACSSLRERFHAATEMSEPLSLFSEVQRSDAPFIAGSDDAGFGEGGSSGDWHFTLILSDPAVSRPDKKNMYIYVNGRRVQEFSLIQAIEYGSQGYYPNGTHPVAALFLTVNPALIDFNIHPAKREVRFKDIQPIHRAVSAATRTFYQSNARESLATLTDQNYLSSIGSSTPYTFQDDIPGFSAASTRSTAESAVTPSPAGSSFHTPSYGGSSGGNHNFGSSFSSGAQPVFERRDTGDQFAAERPAEASFTQLIARTLATQAAAEKSISPNKYGFRYLGQLFDVFLVAEKDNTLYLIDQHAGHERILFNQFMATAGQKQPLLIPYELHTESEEDEAYLTAVQGQLQEAGFTVEKRDDGIWEITTIPVKWKGTSDALQEAILSEKKDPSQIIRTIAAYTACKSAIKEGHYLDEVTACDLIRDVFNCPDPHCPHGRPLWIEFSKEQLYSLIKRT